MPVDSFLPQGRTHPHSQPLKGPKMDQKYAVPNSSTQQIKFRLSGFEEMPQFASVGLSNSTPTTDISQYAPSSTRGGLRTSKVPIMPKPGRTIPKFGVDEMAAAIERTLPTPPPPPTPTSTSLKKTATTSRGSLLNRFDNAVDSAKAHNKTALLKNKFRSDLDKRVKKELGGSEGSPDNFSYRKTRSEDPLAREIDSIQKIGDKMDQIMKGWMPEEDLEKRIRGNSLGGVVPKGLKTDRKAAIPPRSNGKGSLSSTRNSDSKLKVISDGFRSTLNPFASRDPRELIRTPSDDIVDNLNQRHMESLQHKEPNTKKVSAPLKAPRGGGKSNANSSTDLQGLMDFRTLMERQTEHQKRLNNPGGKIGDHFDEEEYSSPVGMISDSVVVSSLTQSTKNLDAAASIAQRLGSLMSRVASQSQSSQASHQQDLTPSNSPIPSPRSRFVPIEELTRRASILKDVAQEAHRSLEGMHSVGVGRESPRAPGRILSTTWSKDAAVFGTSGKNTHEKKKKGFANSKSGQTERGMSTQTDKVEELTKSPSGNFEFVKDMSYTDQLILKKLRGLHASWSEDGDGGLEIQDEANGTGDQLISQGTLAAAIASSRK